MWAKLSAQPYCRWCGGPIPKKTTTFYCAQPGEYTSSDHEYSKTLKVAKHPATKDECQALAGNFTVVSVRKHYAGSGIMKFTAWDGESYEDEFFCTNDCAGRLGRSAAKYSKLATDDWRRAVGLSSTKVGD